MNKANDKIKIAPLEEENLTGTPEEKKWRISTRAISQQNTLFTIIILIALMIGVMVSTVSQMHDMADIALRTNGEQVQLLMDETLNLLEALAKMPEFYDPDVPPKEKAAALNRIKVGPGYFVMCFVDTNFMVHSETRDPSSLAQRDYLQRLFATGEPQITDSFPAGADGVTLNYTVAVPLFDDDGSISGALFSAVYLEEIEALLKTSAEVGTTQAILLGSSGQIMNSTSGLPYDVHFTDILRDAWMVGSTPDLVEAGLLSGEGGRFWGMYKSDLFYTRYQPINNSEWNLIYSISFWGVFQRMFPGTLVMMVLVIIISIVRSAITKKDLIQQSETIDMLLHSVGELERKLYRDDDPGHHDFDEIIRLTSKGLSDGLTGVVTRSVFMDQATARLETLDKNTLNVLCFVDLDNLKIINDSHGHTGGDVALKSVGYILREYEKRYDGVVGRYGGDEFLVLLTGLESETELAGVLDELVLRMHSDVGSAALRIAVQCSVGVAIYQEGKTIDQMISEADEALYFVKQNGKGYYKIHEDRKTHED